MLKQNADHALVSMVTGKVERRAAVTVDGINLHPTHTHTTRDSTLKRPQQPFQPTASLLKDKCMLSLPSTVEPLYKRTPLGPSTLSCIERCL